MAAHMWRRPKVILIKFEMNKTAKSLSGGGDCANCIVCFFVVVAFLDKSGRMFVRIYVNVYVYFGLFRSGKL